MKKLRIYLDTSVIGGCFDKEFDLASNKLFNFFEESKYIPVVSDVVVLEIERAPQNIENKLKALKNLEIISINKEIETLAKEYILKEIITVKYAEDALHIAAATISKADVLVSWNFKHIVNLKKIKSFNTINIKMGYGNLEIRTPQEVIEYE